jgi:hypothetical protein
MTDTNTLKTQYEQAETDAQKLMAEKDDALEKVRTRYGKRLQDANQKAAQAQKAWSDAVAAEALLDRPNGEALAQTLGLTLPK